MNGADTWAGMSSVSSASSVTKCVLICFINHSNITKISMSTPNLPSLKFGSVLKVIVAIGSVPVLVPAPVSAPVSVSLLVLLRL